MAKEIIRLSKCSISEHEKKAVSDVLDREFLGMGSEVLAFEKELECFFGNPVVCVANGTAALHLSLQALGIGPGDEVIVPSLTYVATFQAISASGARPIACDIDAKTLMIDLHDAEKRITKKTKAIIPVHYAGAIQNLDEIYELAKKYSLRIVEDAAHAFGSSVRGFKIGSGSGISCFSFDGIKNITSGEGGCIVTEDKNIISRARDARLLGVFNDSDMRYQGKRSWEFDVQMQGWRYHMSDIMAAIGRVQLRKFSGLAAARQRLATLYMQNLKKIDCITQYFFDYSEIVPHIYVIRIKGLKDRKALREKLLSEGIQTGVHYQPNHQLSFFKHVNQYPLPITDSISSEILTLPLHPDMTDEDVLRVCSTLEAALSL